MDFPLYKKRDVDALIPYANNSRTHSEEQITQVAASIKEFGFLNPVITDGDNGIIAGHCRIMAAKNLGIKQVPCIDAAHLTESQKKAYIIADNKLALNAGWDNDILRIEFEALEEDGFDISLTGFDEDELAALMIEEIEEGLTDEDAVPEIPDEPITKRGDIWLLGNHRVMCGDSTLIDDVDKLMNGEKADMVFTDPPYGINEDGDRSKRSGITQGNKLKSFIDDSTSYAIDTWNMCQAMNIPVQVWWGANYYCHSLPETNNWAIWDKRIEEKQRNNNSDCELAWVKNKNSSCRIFRHLWKGLIKGSEHGQARVHPTQKPIVLAVDCFEFYGKEAKSVLDLFLGSGSTVIAAEQTGRKCYGMELDEKYCDVIVKRWEDFTGKKAKLEEA